MKNIANASTNEITEKEVKVLLVLMEYKLCELLKKDNPPRYPKYFQDLCNKICDHVTFLSITNETTSSEIKKRYNEPTLNEVNNKTMATLKRIMKRWLPECYGNYEYLAIVSN